MISFGPLLARRCEGPAGASDGDPELPPTRIYRLAPGEVAVDLTPLPLETATSRTPSVLETHEPGELRFWPTLEDYRDPPLFQFLCVVWLLMAGAAFLRSHFALAGFMVAACLGLVVLSAYLRVRRVFFLSRRQVVDQWIGLVRTRWPADSVLAVQVIPGLWYDDVHLPSGEFQAYQLNLVLTAGERVNVANSDQLEDVAAVAAAFAFFLDVPLLNEVSWSDFEHPWLLTEFHVPAREFGPGSLHEFPEYFKGQLLWEAQYLSDVQEFLRHCPYVSDQELYGVHDHWAHPCEFERLQRGDCEDRALWAWRQLVELNYDARFMVGWWHVDERPEPHAWVFVFIQDAPYVLETVTSDAHEMLVPWSEAERIYQPRLSVNARGRTARHQLRRSPARIRARPGQTGSGWVQRDLRP